MTERKWILVFGVAVNGILIRHARSDTWPLWTDATGKHLGNCAARLGQFAPHTTSRENVTLLLPRISDKADDKSEKNGLCVW